MLLRLFQTAKTQGIKLITTAHNHRSKNEVNCGGLETITSSREKFRQSLSLYKFSDIHTHKKTTYRYPESVIRGKHVGVNITHVELVK